MVKGPKIKMEALSSEVTGSAYILTIKFPGNVTRKILIDFGGYQESDYNILNEVIEFDPSKIDAVIVTHSHLDHIYKLPLLFKNGYHGKIYCSKISSVSIPISLRDCANVIQKDFEFQKKVNHMNKNDSPSKLLYTHKDVDNMIQFLEPVNYNTQIEILPNITITLLENGHLYGASCILLQVCHNKSETSNILFTGDYNPDNDLFNVNPFPNFVYNLEDLSIVMESTYATTNKYEVEKNFDDYLTSALKKKNFVVIPSISQERLELVLLRLKTLQENNVLDVKIPIYIHSILGQEYYYKIYKNSDCIDCMPKNCKFVQDYDTVLRVNSPKILLASSGMADKGNIINYLPYIVSNQNASIIFTCYQGKGTLGYTIKHSNYGERIFVKGTSQKRYCQVKCTGEFSKHIKCDESILFLQKFSSLKNIFITHGEKKVKDSFSKTLTKIFKNTDIFIMNRETSFYISPISGTTSFPSNFKSLEHYTNLKYKQNYKAKKFKKGTKKRKQHRK